MFEVLLKSLCHNWEIQDDRRSSPWIMQTLFLRPIENHHLHWFNTLKPRQNGRHFPDDIFKRIFLNQNFRIPIDISLKFVPNGPINNIPALVQIMAWRRPGDKPLFETVLVNLLTHICVTRPQWINMTQSCKHDTIPQCIWKPCRHHSYWRPMCTWGILVVFGIKMTPNIILAPETDSSPSN